MDLVKKTTLFTIESDEPTRENNCSGIEGENDVGDVNEKPVARE